MAYLKDRQAHVGKVDDSIGSGLNRVLAQNRRAGIEIMFLHIA